MKAELLLKTSEYIQTLSDEKARLKKESIAMELEGKRNCWIQVARIDNLITSLKEYILSEDVR